MQTVLVCEDDEIMSKMYRKELEDKGYRVKTAINGVDGLRMAMEEKPDLILLDMKMPVKDGLSMLEELRQDEWGRTAKVIVASGVDPDGDMLSRVSSAGPTYYLLKGDKRPDEVMEMVADVLNG